MRRLSVRVQNAQAWPCDPLVQRTGSGYWSQRCQKNYHRDNWLVAAKRSKRRCFLILRCRLFLASHPQPSGRVGLFTHQQGTWAGFRPSWDRLVLPSCRGRWTRKHGLLLWTGVTTAAGGSTRGTLMPRPWFLRSVERPVPRRYHAMDTGWTHLSPNPGPGVCTPLGFATQ